MSRAEGLLSAVHRAGDGEEVGARGGAEGACCARCGSHVRGFLKVSWNAVRGVGVERRGGRCLCFRLELDGKVKGAKAKWVFGKDLRNRLRLLLGEVNDEVHFMPHEVCLTLGLQILST